MYSKYIIGPHSYMNMISCYETAHCIHVMHCNYHMFVYIVVEIGVAIWLIWLMNTMHLLYIDNQYESYSILKGLICDMYSILVNMILIIYANGR